ncbi:MAG: type IV secretory system conjugative DNA transfer family protein [Blastocatellia bacterium]
MTWLRAWSATGSAVVLDPKGELYDQTAYKFENVYRIDLQDTERSDRWNFLPSCRHNDEAGNIFIHGLNELLGVGRGRKMAVALGYQNIGQVYHHYGSDGGDAVLGSIGTMIFLPGLDHRTAEYASKRIGQTTVWQSTSVDVKDGTKFDSERMSEVGRSLMDAPEVRRMVKYRQAVAIIGNAPPVRFSYPPLAMIGSAPQPKRERFWRAGNSLPYTPNLNGTTCNGSMVVKTAAEPITTNAAIITDNRPAFSLGQMMSQKTSALPPEYDPDQIPPQRDPCFDDAPDRIGFER